MATRRVRGETGATFEVDASMLDGPEERAVDYRGSSAPPPTSAITRAPARPRPSGLIRAAVIVLIWFAVAIVYAWGHGHHG